MAQTDERLAELKRLAGGFGAINPPTGSRAHGGATCGRPRLPAHSPLARRGTPLSEYLDAEAARMDEMLDEAWLAAGFDDDDSPLNPLPSPAQVTPLPAPALERWHERG